MESSLAEDETAASSDSLIPMVGDSILAQDVTNVSIEWNNNNNNKSTFSLQKIILKSVH